MTTVFITLVPMATAEQYPSYDKLSLHFDIAVLRIMSGPECQCGGHNVRHRKDRCFTTGLTSSHKGNDQFLNIQWFEI